MASFTADDYRQIGLEILETPPASLDEAELRELGEFVTILGMERPLSQEVTTRYLTMFRERSQYYNSLADLGVSEQLRLVGEIGTVALSAVHHDASPEQRAAIIREQ